MGREQTREEIVPVESGLGVCVTVWVTCLSRHDVLMDGFVLLQGSYPVWEDFINKAGKLQSQLR